MRRLGVFILSIVLCLILCVCSGKSSTAVKHSRTEFVFGTVVTLTVYDEDDSSLDGAFALCRQYEELFSSTVDGSDVWKINHSEGESVAVDSETAELILLSLEYSRLTDGAFDITIAPISALWGFSSEYPSVPDSDRINELLPLVDYNSITVEGNNVTVPKGYSIELGAIAKGYISDKLCEYFRNCGVSAALVNLGGNVASVGVKPDGSPWQIGIRNPSGDYSDYVCTLSLNETSVVTSGIYERCFEEDGVSYHHLLSTVDGYPVNNDIASVTVICESGVDADALSTSLYLMGFEKAFEYAEQSDMINAVFVLRNGQIHKTSDIEFN